MDESWYRHIRENDRATPDEDRLDDEYMTAAELRCAMDYLGLAQDDLARLLDVEERTVRRWLQGPVRNRANRIPTNVRLSIEDLEDRTAQAVGALVEELKGSTDVEVIVHRTDDELWADHPVYPLPARWWRHIAMRAATEVPGVAMTYPPTE